MTTPARIADAVTAVLLHDGEIFVVRRTRDLAAFPGYTAFPGGKVDPGDSDARLEGGSFAEHPPRLIRALARELQEELGFNFLQAYRQRQIKSIQSLGQATTPAFAPLRFRTWFFLIRLTQRPKFELDTREAEAGEWASAKQLVNSYQQGQRLIGFFLRVQQTRHPQAGKLTQAAILAVVDHPLQMADGFVITMLICRHLRLPQPRAAGTHTAQPIPPPSPPSPRHRADLRPEPSHPSSAA